MSNIPGAVGVVPGIYSEVTTISSGVSVPGGSRLACLMGEGQRTEVLVSAALGGGLDGQNPTYTGVTGADGRHFATSLFPLISNRTVLYRNGIPLVGLESLISTSAFDNRYDYRIDPVTGHIEMQKAHLVDQGGSFWTAGTQNYGAGDIQGLVVLDPNAPTETWTVKCASVQRDGYGLPVIGTAKFTAFGSVSGTILDGYGNPIIWKSDNVAVSNGTLSFSIHQDPTVGALDFKENDSFTIKVASGVLIRNDSLTVAYIAVDDINSPFFFDSMVQLTKKHGQPSTDNNLSLGAQLAFSNSTPGVVTLQTAPAVPRRTNISLSKGVKSTSTNIEDFLFPLPVGVTADANSSVHFFVTNPATGVESQIIPNKYPFFTLTDASSGPSLNDFVFSATTYGYDYTLVQRPQVLKSGSDGVLTDVLAIPGTAVLSTPSFLFAASDIGYKVKLFDTVNTVNTGTFDAVSDTNGKLKLSFSLFASESAVQFTLVNSSGTVIQTITDGVITPDSIDGTKATITSASTDFSLIAPILTYTANAAISSHASNNGQFLISSVASQHVIVVKKYFVTESPISFEVYDPNKSGTYVAINKSVVPATYPLRVTLIDSRDTAFYDAGWLSALSVMETVDVDIVVPLPKQTISAIFQNVVSHCRTMSNIQNKLERVAFIGAINGLTPANVIGTSLAAVEDIGILEGIQGHNVQDILSGNIEDLANYSVPSAYGNTFRCVYFYPDQIIVTAGGQNVIVDGFYMAAAAAGYLCSVTNVAIPLTSKVLAGFTVSVKKKFSPTVLQQLLAAGITIVQPVSGGGTVIQGISTSQSGFVEESEISIIFIRDRIAKTFRAGLNGFVGQPQSATLIGSMSTRAVGLLTGFISQGLITAFTDLKIIQDPVDPRQINISVKVAPVYPCDYVYIKVSIGVL